MGRMGGYGRWTVEGCKSISSTFLNKNGYFRGWQPGGIRWTNNQGEEIGSVGISVSVSDHDPTIRFQYTRTDPESGLKEDLDYSARLSSTKCYFGGKRWWFRCPLVVNNVPCNRRVTKLYLGGKYFGCRRCYNLAYTSSQESHKFDRLFTRIGAIPEQAKRYLKGLT